MDKVKTVSAGYNCSFAIKQDGSLWTWGSNSYGQLGDGTKEDRYTPVKIMGDAVAVSAGSFHTLAIKKDGSLWAWGENTHGELGNGKTTSSSIPVKIMDGMMVPQPTPKPAPKPEVVNDAKVLEVLKANPEIAKLSIFGRSTLDYYFDEEMSGTVLYFSLAESTPDKLAFHRLGINAVDDHVMKVAKEILKYFYPKSYETAYEHLYKAVTEGVDFSGVYDSREFICNSNGCSIGDKLE